MCGLVQPVFRLPYVPLEKARREQGAALLRAVQQHIPGCKEVKVLEDHEFQLIGRCGGAAEGWVAGRLREEGAGVWGAAAAHQWLVVSLRVAWRLTRAGIECASRRQRQCSGTPARRPSLAAARPPPVSPAVPPPPPSAARPPPVSPAVPPPPPPAARPPPVSPAVPPQPANDWLPPREPMPEMRAPRVLYVFYHLGVVASRGAKSISIG